MVNFSKDIKQSQETLNYPYTNARYGTRVGVNHNIDIFDTANLIKMKTLSDNLKINNIDEKWYGIFLTISDKKSSFQQTEKTDALRVDNQNNKIAADFKSNHGCLIRKGQNVDADKIITNMHKKWSSKFKNSPLDRDFYSKLYDTLKILNCSIKDSDFKKDIYSSKEEQTMDEFIAIFAGEAQLNPAAKNYIYRGLFQLAKDGLTDLKIWASKNQNIPGMKNIKNINIEQFGHLSGSEQLDYLVAYIGKAREYSKIPKNQSITPGQVWAMIKNPFKGQINSQMTLQKNNAIKKVFTNSSIQLGIKA